MEPFYMAHTRDNYEGRHGRFATWSENRSNSLPAAKCRDLLLHYLTQSLTEAALSGFKVSGPLKILDAGCGPGRDLAAFTEETVEITPAKQPSIKFEVECVGFDCCQGFIDRCQSRGLNAVLADFISFFDTLEPDERPFHAIFALASLFHLPKSELIKTLELFHRHMHENGILLSTISEGLNDGPGGDGRWKLCLPETEQRKLIEDAGFTILHTERVDIYNGCWILIVARK